MATSDDSTDGGAVPVELDPEECFELLASGGVGRVAFDDGEGPTVLPVNFVVHERAVVFRTAFGGRLDQSLTTVLRGARIRIAFEVDALDARTETGWSVVLRGGARHLGPDEAAAIPALKPWAAGARDAFISLSPSEVSGRRLVRPSH